MPAPWLAAVPDAPLAPEVTEAAVPEMTTADAAARARDVELLESLETERAEIEAGLARVDEAADAPGA